MSAIAKAGKPALATAVPGFEHSVNGLKSGEPIAAGDACYISNANGRVYRSSGAAVAAAAKVRGYAQADASVGEPVSLYHGIAMRYGAGLAPGVDVYLSGTVPGGLDDAPSTGGTAAIGFTIDDTRVFLARSAY